MPKNTNKGKGKKKQSIVPVKQSKFDLQARRSKKRLPAYLFKFRKPSRRIGSGGVLTKSASLGRLVRWPKYVKLQRQRKVLLQRLKVPPALNLFNTPCSKEFAKKLVQFLRKYSPESPKEKKERLRSFAKLQEQGESIPNDKPITIKYGFNHVTNLIEQGKAKLVIIAHDVDPIELVLWMPALCVKKNVPFVIFKSKARLGTLVNKKTASCVAICGCRPDDSQDFKNLQRNAKRLFNGRYNALKKRWGKRTLAIKTKHKIEKRKRQRKLEAERRKAAQS